MKKLLLKELKLTASPLSYFFILAGLLTFFPGYPILLSGFFVCLGIFQTFQSARESADILYSALLPIKKSDTVKSKYIFCMFIELCGFILSAAVTLLRMTVLKDAVPYRTNALMNANFVYLGFLLIIFGCFNAVFVNGFFKTAYYFAKPFVLFIVTSFLVVGIAETAIHIPMLSALNSFGFENMTVQILCLTVGAVLYLILTLLSERKAEKYFENIDL